MLGVMDPEGGELRCVRCGRPVARNAANFDTFERMHWVCFHYEFEHDPVDPDTACGDPNCPARAFDKRPRPDWLEERGIAQPGSAPGN